MTDDERNALAAIKIADAVDILLNVLDGVLILSNGDMDKIVAVRMLLNEARTAAFGVDRGALKPKE